MSVSYSENEAGVFWVEGDQQGEPQINLHHAMKDYEATVRGKVSNGSEERVHTGDDGGTGEAAGQLADNAGSVGGPDEEADTNSGEGGTR